MLPKFISNFRITSRAALKGCEGREFDTPDLQRNVKEKLVKQAEENRSEMTSICFEMMKLSILNAPTTTRESKGEVKKIRG